MWVLTKLGKINKFCAFVSGYVLMGLTFLIVFEMVSRRYFDYSLQGVDELGGYIVATTGTFSFAYGLYERSHTRIDIVLDRVPEVGRAVLNALAFVTAAAAAVFMAKFAWQALSESIMFSSTSPTPLQTPIWVPQSIWFAGLVLFALTAIAMAVHAVILVAKSPRMANAAYGPSSISEELERELADAAKRRDAILGGEGKND
jgi:TRAP-type C4-dicarboxylate transport system permease small subunit